nr:hypothetical protein [Halorubrum ezzemoulense]
MDPVATVVPKACAYLTRDAEEFLVFEGSTTTGCRFPRALLSLMSVLGRPSAGRSLRRAAFRWTSCPNA